MPHALLLPLLLVSAPLMAQDPQPIVLSGTVEVARDIVVLAGSALRIEPGTTLRFAPGAGLVVHGRVLAEGTREQPISFLPTDAASGWANLMLVGEAAQGSRLRWCRFVAGRGRAAYVPELQAKQLYDGWSCGGAVFAYRVPGIAIEDCCFEGSSAYYGGALCLWGEGTSGTIVRCLFRGNTAGEDGGAIHCVGGAKPVIRHCRIVGNRTQFGGAIHCLGGADAEIVHNLIEDNHATRGGGAISSYNASPRLMGNLIVRNACDGRGGGVQCAMHAIPVLEGNHLAENTGSEGAGAGLYAHDGEVGGGVKDTSRIDVSGQMARADVERVLGDAGVPRLADCWDAPTVADASAERRAEAAPATRVGERPVPGAPVSADFEATDARGAAAPSAETLAR